MTKQILVCTSVLAIATSAALIPTKASADDDWDQPLLGVSVGDFSVGVGVNDDDDDGPRGAVFVPANSGYCHTGREMGPNGYWHRVQVCE